VREASAVLSPKLDTLAEVALEEVDLKLKEAVLEKVLSRVSPPLQRLGFTEETFDVAVSQPVPREEPLPVEGSIIEALAARATKEIEQKKSEGRNPIGIDTPSSTLQRDKDGVHHLVLKMVPAEPQ